MRTGIIALIFVAAGACASDGARAFVFWDGKESVADYAKKVNLAPTKTVDLGSAVSMEFVLIPAGTFLMGTPEPEKPAVTVQGSVSIMAVGGALVFLLLAVLAEKWRRTGRANYSLLSWMAFCLGLGLMVSGAVRWHKAEGLWKDYVRKMEAYERADPNEKPARMVTIEKPFYMGKYEVTIEQQLAIHPQFGGGT